MREKTAVALCALSSIIAIIATPDRHSEYARTYLLRVINKPVRIFRNIFASATPDYAECNGYKFEKVSSNVPFAARDGAGAVFHNGKLFLIGGWNPLDKQNFPLGTSNDVWSSDDYGKSWKEIKTNSFNENFNASSNDFEGRHTAGYLSHNGYIYVIGGDANQGYHINNIARSKDGISWEIVNENPPWAPRGLHITFAIGDYMYVLGGQTMPKFATQTKNLSETYFRDLWKSKDGMNWKKVDLKFSIKPRGGVGGSGFVNRDLIVIPGGFTYENIINESRDVWSTALIASSLNPEEFKEVQMQPKSELKYQYADTGVYDRKFWIIGGAKRTLGNTNDVWSSLDGINWEELKCSPLTPTHATSVWSTPQGIYIGAGNGWSKDIFKLSKTSS